MYWTCNSIYNLWSYCGLVDAKIWASDKDLPVTPFTLKHQRLRFLSWKKINLMLFLETFWNLGNFFVTFPICSLATFANASVTFWKKITSQVPATSLISRASWCFSLLNKKVKKLDLHFSKFKKKCPLNHFF